MSETVTIDRPSRQPIKSSAAFKGTISNRRVVRAITIGDDVFPVKQITEPEEEVATAKSVRKFKESTGKRLSETDLIRPPINLNQAMMLQERSTVLRPLIEAMVTNIEAFGYRFVCKVSKEKLDEDATLNKAVIAERTRLTNFFNNIHPMDTFIELRKKKRWDQEQCGNAYWEVIRNPLTGRIQSFESTHAHRIRIGPVQSIVMTKMRQRNLMEDGTWQNVEVEVPRRFRNYAQVDESGRVAVWFKQFGDLRPMDRTTGEYGAVDPSMAANELIHWPIHCSRSPYGVPRFIGNLITIFGDRAADEINYITLDNNNIPSMVVAVSNGYLTEETVARMKDFVAEQIRGKSNYSRFLILEADSGFEGFDSATPRIDIKPLTSEQMRDQLFQEYSKNNRDKVRESFRLPPIFTGSSSDYNRATAEASRRLADEQVFDPERRSFDDVLNKLILPELDIQYHDFASQGPNVTDDKDLIEVMKAAERSGGMTPELAWKIVGDILGREVPYPLKGIDPDKPFTIQLAEAVKNTAPVTVGSQVTALKDLTDGPPVQDWLMSALGLRAQLDAALIDWSDAQ